MQMYGKFVGFPRKRVHCFGLFICSPAVVFLVSGSGNSERLPGAHQHDGTLPARARGNANALIGNATKRRLPGWSPTKCYFFWKRIGVRRLQITRCKTYIDICIFGDIYLYLHRKNIHICICINNNISTPFSAVQSFTLFSYQPFVPKGHFTPIPLILFWNSQ